MPDLCVFIQCVGVYFFQVYVHKGIHIYIYIYNSPSRRTCAAAGRNERRTMYSECWTRVRQTTPWPLYNSRNEHCTTTNKRRPGRVECGRVGGLRFTTCSPGPADGPSERAANAQHDVFTFILAHETCFPRPAARSAAAWCGRPAGARSNHRRDTTGGPHLRRSPAASRPRFPRVPPRRAARPCRSVGKAGSASALGRRNGRTVDRDDGGFAANATGQHCVAWLGSENPVLAAAVRTINVAPGSDDNNITRDTLTAPVECSGSTRPLHTNTRIYTTLYNTYVR